MATNVSNKQVFLWQGTDKQGRKTKGELEGMSTALVKAQLRKQGIVEGEKGWGGGFRLRPGARNRPIGEILAFFEGVESINREDCAFGLPECSVTDPCPLHPYWEGIRQLYREMLSETTMCAVG